MKGLALSFLNVVFWALMLIGFTFGSYNFIEADIAAHAVMQPQAHSQQVYEVVPILFDYQTLFDI